MQINKAIFKQSCQDIEGKPPVKLPEFAFIGRSNVGKSSLINNLCSAKKLALTSSTPGKTVLINYFLINDAFYFVDLPGYGYAKLPKKEKGRISKMNSSYISKSKELELLFVLIDARHKIQDIDMEFLFNLGNAAIPFAIIFTKADKMSQSQLHRQIEANKAQILEHWEEMPPYFLSSSLNSLGKEEILDYIGKTLIIIRDNNKNNL